MERVRDKLDSGQVKSIAFLIPSSYASTMRSRKEASEYITYVVNRYSAAIVSMPPNLLANIVFVPNNLDKYTLLASRYRSSLR